MKRSYPYLNDTTFLKQIINSTNVEYYVKVIILNWEEQPIKEIQGKITSANININGTSSLRRTANVTFVMEDNDEDAESFLTINKKIYLQIGYLNQTSSYEKYNIIWFPLGLYVVTGISFSHSNSDVTASLQLKDKMCLLNGECGGVLPASVVFDSVQTQDLEGNVIITKATIYQIITELVNHFGKEQLGNIIISDVDTRVKRIMTWSGSSPLYILKSSNSSEGESTHYITADQVDYNSKLDHGYENVQGSPFQPGSNVGFILDDFYFPGDLIGNAGDSVVTILDRIKETLGNYEYFYDIDGHFRFQEIKNYLNNAQSKYLLQALNNTDRSGNADPKLVPDYLSAGQAYLMQRNNTKAVFSFKQNNNLVISYANTPQINAIKNDYVVWGLRKTTSGKQYPIRYHLAIDDKPKTGHTYRVFQYKDKWYRPLQFSGSIDNFPSDGIQGVFYAVEGSNNVYQWKKKDNLSQYVLLQGVQLEQIVTSDWRTQLYFQGVSAEPYGLDSNYYYTELKTEWPKIYDVRRKRFRDQIIKDPTKMDFYLDFISPVTKHTQKISVGNIGRRTVITNENENVNCVFEPYIPDIVLIHENYDGQHITDMSKMREECISKGYMFAQIKDNIYNYLIPGIGLNSAYEQIRQNLYQYINYSENVTLQTLPIYFLEPNTCIQIQDKNSFIQGNYMINSLSFSLDVSSSLSINASKLIERF